MQIDEVPVPPQHDSVAIPATCYITHRRRTVMLTLGKVSTETKGFKQNVGEGTGRVLI